MRQTAALANDDGSVPYDASDHKSKGDQFDDDQLLNKGKSKANSPHAMQITSRISG
jgi:hypothetical protein